METYGAPVSSLEPIRIRGVGGRVAGSNMQIDMEVIEGFFEKDFTSEKWKELISGELEE